MKKQVKVGLLGLGTVGGGVYKTLLKNRVTILERTGCAVEVVNVLVRDREKERGFVIDDKVLCLEPQELLGDEQIDIYIEVIGGIHPAKEIIEAALTSKRHVITANKELMAKHGAQLLRLAEQNGVHLLFEASVAGGIPVIHMLQGYLTANRVHEISGILNGTSNYILTEMTKTGRSFPEVLAEAQALGYAEADPTSDVEGYDAAYKLAILTNLAYDACVEVEAIDRQGISAISGHDLLLAERMGYAVKLIGHVQEQDGAVQLSVKPRLLPSAHPLARVGDVFNAVTLRADVVGDLTLIGRGAGELPTASAVIEDLTALLTQGDTIRRPSWKRPLAAAAKRPEQTGCYFLSLTSCPEQAQELALAVQRAVESAGGLVADYRTAVAADGLHHAWLLGGVTEEQVHRTVEYSSQIVAEPLSTLLLNVEGEIKTGVKWEAEASGYETNARYA
ncbi:homoserine dehydrogenase [Tumebacillus sp. BK434]|uniref:homoserine dehydrogenase n=1 Tax=Tumebacillus sp. BK434 TaxID=2512169 RepID=UPI001050B4DC|nr:homoserine dehydrogenase [Tumebacillus sp. BK434]TCP54734.1 homoserine dehydrogenase [Tumebacillus sp. BK434]